MGLLDGKRMLITGVLTDASLGFGVAELAQEEGAEIVLTGAGRGLVKLTERTARKLPTEPEVLEFDVTDPEPGRGGARAARRAMGPRRRRAARHRVRPRGVPGRHVPRRHVGRRRRRRQHLGLLAARRWPTWSLPLMTEGGSIVGLDFDATVALAGLRLDGRGQGRARVDLPLPGPLPRPRGIRVNLVAAGPVKTLAARSIPGFSSSRTCGTTGPRSAGT